MIDDSQLLIHAGRYDPQKAREYYLRTRQLKGRPKGQSLDTPSSLGPASNDALSPGSKATREKTPSKQAQLREQRAALEKRLDRLREVLAQAVEAAQARSGVAPTTSEKKETAEKSSTKEKKSKELSTSEKKAKAKEAREDYEKTGGTSLSKDIEVLKQQVQDIRKQIEEALASARRKAEKPKGSTLSIGQPQALSSGPPKALSGGKQNLIPNGPRGR